jgi:hypothetical protein
VDAYSSLWSTILTLGICWCEMYWLPLCKTTTQWYNSNCCQVFLWFCYQTLQHLLPFHLSLTWAGGTRVLPDFFFQSEVSRKFYSKSSCNTYSFLTPHYVVQYVIWHMFNTNRDYTRSYWTLSKQFNRHLSTNIVHKCKCKNP